ncbi:hypothetical protein D3C78_1730570 [compost metagenome]
MSTSYPTMARVLGSWKLKGSAVPMVPQMNLPRALMSCTVSAWAAGASVAARPTAVTKEAMVVFMVFPLGI